jgi:hypothetical protein
MWLARGSETSKDHDIMSLGTVIREAWEVVPILLLLLVGGAIAVKSGVGRLTSNLGAWQVAGNLSRVVLRVLGYVVVLLMVQYWIGMRPVLGW